MRKFLSFAIVLLLLVSGPAWARKKKSSEDGGTTKHSRHKHPKGSKGSRSKSGAEFKVKGEIDKSSVTFDFKDKERSSKRKSKKAEEDGN